MIADIYEKDSKIKTADCLFEQYCIIQNIYAVTLRWMMCVGVREWAVGEGWGCSLHPSNKQMYKIVWKR